MSYRMSHQDWLRAVRPTRQTPNVKARKHVTGRKVNTYVVGYGGRKRTFKALTKSEARSQLKAVLGLDRLPPGVVFNKVNV